jgi:transaldolase
MGASFRNIGEITELAGCDLLTIAPKFLKELTDTKAPLARKLDAADSRAMNIQPIPMAEADFRAAHEKNRMAKDKLAQGIADFSKAIIAVEELLKEKLQKAKA